MGYEIKKIENNTFNHYKYHYLDHMCCVIDIKDNYWDFQVDLYSINNFKLPLNSLAGDLNLPFQQIESIAFNLSSDQTNAKIGVKHNEQYSKIYSGHFSVDISRNEYLKQDLNNVKLNLELGLYIDPEAIKAAGSEISQDALDDLVNETHEQRWSFEMYYTNTYHIKQTGKVDNIHSYKMPLGNLCIPIVKEVNITSDVLTGMACPFNKLTSISSSTQFQILSAKVKFYYWIKTASEPKTIEKIIEVDKTPSNTIDINLNDSTIYDYEKNEVVFNPSGAKGFYIPEYSNGYYELELNILQNTTLNKFVVTNWFDFTNHIGKPIIGISHKVINDISDFKEVIY